LMYLQFFEGVLGCRSLLVVIFPMLGYFDGRAALAGEPPKRRATAALILYTIMAWPLLVPVYGEGFATFHRWPVWVWIWCLMTCRVAKSLKIPPVVLVAAAFLLSPILGSTPDSLHSLLGGKEPTSAGAWADPSLLFLEHQFYYSVGAKVYFAGCYFVGYYYLTRDSIRSKVLDALHVSPLKVRASALLAFISLTITWQRLTPAFDPDAQPEMAAWPNFFSSMYPLHALTDWAAMALLVLAVGQGTLLLRMVGGTLLGSMVCHMYLQLPLTQLLVESSQRGGAFLMIAVFVAAPVIYALSVGRIFQRLLLLPFAGMMSY